MPPHRQERVAHTVSAMPPHFLGTTITVAALLLAAWSLVPVLRDRTLGVTHWAGVAIVEILVAAQVGSGVLHLAAGAHPRQFVTFIGYLIAFLLVLPLAATLARMEPTRWGALIVTVGALLVPVLVLRLDQLWAGRA
jgi:hypothetical protein